MSVSADPAADARFVGSHQCVDCHGEIDTAWRQSDHHRAMLLPSESSVLGDFADVTVEFHGIKTRLFQADGRYRVATAGADGKPAEFDVAYTFGHFPVQQYLIDIGDGHLQALNVAWDSRSAEQGGQRWYHLQPDEDITPDHPFFWTRHFQNANSRCIECHATDVKKNYDLESGAYATAWSEIGVGCESCHGPASRHLELAEANELSEDRTGFARKAQPRLNWSYLEGADIASPSGTRDDSFIDTCGGCHSLRGSLGDAEAGADYHDQYRLALLDRGLYFADGQINDEVFVLGSFLQSKMHLAGVTCGNCHDPHSGKTIADGNALCAQCHKPTVFDTAEHHHHPQGSSGAQCANCHMPERLYMGVDYRRDHSYSIPDPGLASAIGAPDACTICHTDQSQSWAAVRLADWGVKTKPNSWARFNAGLQRQDALLFRDYARNRKPAANAPIRQATLLSRLAAFPSQLAVETAAEKLASDDPLIRRAAVNALQSLPLEGRWQLLQPLMRDPVRAIRLDVANALADTLPRLQGDDAQRLGDLIDEYREYLDFIADTPAGQLNIGNLEWRLGYSILAERAYLRALEIEPGFVPALLNLADLYRSMGTDGEARPLLERALETAPNSADANHAYGLLLVRSGQQDEALEYFRAAVEQDSAGPNHIYVYAVALDSSGDSDAAIRLIEEASQRWSNNLDLYFLQVSLMDKIGKTENIQRYLSLLARVASDNPQVKNWTRKYGGQ